VLRDTSAQRTIGGGRLVDLRAPARRRRTAPRLAQLEAMLTDAPVAALLDLPPYYLDLDAFWRDRAASPADIDAIRLAARGTTYALSRRHWAAFQQSLCAALAAFHAANPAADGAPLDTLRRTVEPRLPAYLFAAALGELARQDVIAIAGGLARLPDHATRLSPAQDALWQKIRPLLGDGDRFQPPRVADVAKKVGTSEGDTRKFMKQLAAFGLLEEVAPDRFFLRTAVVEAANMVGSLGQSPEGEFGAAQLRDRLDTGRKSAIELLEYFDRRGVTVRRGDLRRVDMRKLALLR
jgi:selenocysteine-specific elongation factor